MFYIYFVTKVNLLQLLPVYLGYICSYFFFFSSLSSESDHVIVCIWVLSDNDDRQKYSVKVPHTATPQLVIAEAIRRRTRSMKLTADQQQMCIRQFSNIYVLKVCGCNQYLLEEHPLSQYKVSWKHLQWRFAYWYINLKKKNIYVCFYTDFRIVFWSYRCIGSDLVLSYLSVIIIIVSEEIWGYLSGQAVLDGCRITLHCWLNTGTTLDWENTKKKKKRFL